MNLSAIDLNVLYAVHVTLEEGSVGKAAKRLGVSSPAVSNTLARARALLGDPLFVRAGRGIVPTPLAEELRPALAAAVAGLEHVIERAERFEPERCERQFTIALTDAHLVSALPQLATAMAKAMPRAALRGISVDTLIHVGGLSSTEVDLAIGPPYAFGEEGLSWEPLFEERVALVVSAANDDPALQGTIALSALAGRPFVDIEVALGRTGVGGSAAEALLAAIGGPPQRRVVVPSFTAAAFCVATSDAFTGLPGRMAAVLVDNIGLRRLDVEVPMPPFVIGVAWHRRADADPAVRAFRDLVIATLGEPVATGARGAGEGQMPRWPPGAAPK